MRGSSRVGGRSGMRVGVLGRRRDGQQKTSGRQRCQNSALEGKAVSL
jgi:hypothetical protein